MKVRQLLYEAGYPASVPTSYVIDLVKRIHHRSEDFTEGNLLNRIWRFRRYELKQIPIQNLQIRWYTDADEISRFVAMSSSTSPPIIFDPLENSIIDGTHRVAAAIQRGDQTILSYIGTDPDPNWSDDEEEE